MTHERVLLVLDAANIRPHGASAFDARQALGNLGYTPDTPPTLVIRANFAPVDGWRERKGAMKIKVVIHEAEEGGYWAEVPAIPGCATQGETFEELLSNLYEAVEGCLDVDVELPTSTRTARVVEISV